MNLSTLAKEIIKKGLPYLEAIEIEKDNISITLIHTVDNIKSLPKGDREDIMMFIDSYLNNSKHFQKLGDNVLLSYENIYDILDDIKKQS